MKTCSWFAVGAAPGRVGISLAVPRGMPAGYRRYRALTPTREILHMADGQWQGAYVELLGRLDARRVWDELHQLTGGAEPVMLCFERDRCDCHRGLVARWFERELGAEVAELGEQRRLL